MITANWQWSLDIEDEILKEVKGCYPIIHVCSGASGIGDIRIDRYFDLNSKWKVERHGKQAEYKGEPSLRADMCFLPIKSGIAGATICDPPYSWQRYHKLFRPLINELARITAPGGKVIQIFPQVLYHKTLKPLRFWLRPSGDTFVPSYKMLSISQKVNAQISDYERSI